MTKRAWDGKTYDRIGTPQLEWGKVVLDRMQLRGDETIVDAGCGSGRVTELLLERLPEGQVIALDGSASMIDAARERLGSHANVEFAVMDLLELDLGGRQVDGVISTATFHWITDHGRLFERLHAVIRPGGQLIAQCGGKGNIANVLTQAYAVMAEPAWAETFATTSTRIASPMRRRRRSCCALRGSQRQPAGCKTRRSIRRSHQSSSAR